MTLKNSPDNFPTKKLNYLLIHKSILVFLYLLSLVTQYLEISLRMIWDDQILYSHSAIVAINCLNLFFLIEKNSGHGF